MCEICACHTLYLTTNRPTASPDDPHDRLHQVLVLGALGQLEPSKELLEQWLRRAGPGLEGWKE